jgi:hypothetical protein
MFQHSAMAKPLFKKALYSLGLQVAERSIYVIASSIVLQVSLFFKILNLLKQDICRISVYKIRSYVTENTLHLSITRSSQLMLPR